MTTDITTNKARTLAAIGYIVLGYFCYSLADLCSKILQDTYSVYQVLSVSGGSGLLITAVWLYMKHGAKSFLPSNLKLHLIRSVFVLGTAYFMVRALSLLPMADFYGIVFVMPFLVMILAIFMLGERVGWRRWVAAIVGFAGVVVIAGPQFEQIGEGVICAFLGALFAAMNIIWLRKIGPGAPLALYGFYPFLFILVFNVLGTAISGTYVQFQLEHLPYFLMHGPVVVVAITLTSIGFSTAPEAAVVAPFNYTQIIWGVLFGYVFFNVMPTNTTWAGIIMIVAAGLYSIWREYKRTHAVPVK